MAGDPIFFRDLALVLLAAVIGGALAWYAGQPLVLGYVLGAITLYYVVGIVRQDVAGIELAYRFPLGVAFAVAPVILGAGFLAAIWPAETAVRGRLVEALEYE